MHKQVKSNNFISGIHVGLMSKRNLIRTRDTKTWIPVDYVRIILWISSTILKRSIVRKRRRKNDRDQNRQKVGIAPDPGLGVVLVQDRPRKRVRRINVINPRIGMMKNHEKTKRKVKRIR